MTRLEALSKRIIQHAKYEPECHEHYVLDDILVLLACVDEMRGALNAIACWDDGDVGFHMDEPASAQHARETLASIEEKLR